MGIGNFFKNLFSSEKVDEIVVKAETFADDAYAKAKEGAAPLLDQVESFADQAGEKIKEFIKFSQNR